MNEYVRVIKDEYDELMKIKANHRYLLSGEMSYGNSLKNDKQKLQDKLDKINTCCRENIELWKNDYSMVAIWHELLQIIERE